MLEICICEDNLVIRKQITDLVNKYCLISEVDASLSLSTADPLLVLQYFESVKEPVLFFLDIDLGVEMNGMDLATKIRETNKQAFIVFFTTKSEMVPLTFKYQLEALDFIVKTDSADEIKERIVSAINTASSRIVRSHTGKIFRIKHDDKLLQIPMNDLLYLETTGVRYKLNLHMANKRMTINGELKKIEADLDERFIRCHQSYLINGDHIMEVDYGKNIIVMTDGSEVMMSRSGKKLVKDFKKE